MWGIILMQFLILCFCYISDLVSRDYSYNELYNLIFYFLVGILPVQFLFKEVCLYLGPP